MGYSRSGCLLPSIYADACYIDDVIVFKAAEHYYLLTDTIPEVDPTWQGILRTQPQMSCCLLNLLEPGGVEHTAQMRRDLHTPSLSYAKGRGGSWCVWGAGGVRGTPSDGGNASLYVCASLFYTFV